MKKLIPTIALLLSLTIMIASDLGTSYPGYTITWNWFYQVPLLTVAPIACGYLWGKLS